MTMEGITFNLGFGTSPFVVTINDTLGLAPLELPRAFVADRHLPQPPSDDAICRFEAALSAGAAPADAKQRFKSCAESSLRLQLHRLNRLSPKGQCHPLHQ